MIGSRIAFATGLEDQPQRLNVHLDRRPVPGVGRRHAIRHVGQTVAGVEQRASVEETRQIQNARRQSIDLGGRRLRPCGAQPFQPRDGGFDLGHDFGLVAAQALIGAAFNIRQGATARLGHLLRQRRPDLLRPNLAHSDTLCGFNSMSMSA